MRLAFVNPQGNFDSGNSHLAAHPDFGGQLVYVREIARTLSEAGHPTDILTRRVVDPDWPEFEDETDSYPNFDNVRIIRIPCGPDSFLPKEELWPYLGEWVDGIARFYEREGSWPDLWTGHYADGGLCAALLEEKSGVPFTFTGHSLGAWKLDQILRDTEDKSDETALAAADSRYNFGARIEAERVAMARASAIITNSSVERNEQYGHPAYRDVADPEKDQRFTVIPPGVNPEIFSARARSPWEDEVLDKVRWALERDILPGRHGLPAVIAWSRLDPKKNHLALVEAFAGQPELREKANLIMITRGLEDPLREPGSANEEQRKVLRPLVARIEAADLWGCVSAFSLSGQSALAALYRWGVATGGLFCLPAEHEPFGMSVVEAMAVGLPVVVTNNGGPREIVAGGHAGLLASPHDPMEMGDQLLRLLSDHEIWRTYAARGLERVREHYSWPRAAESYVALAERILSEKRRTNHPPPLPEFIREPSNRLPVLRSWRTDERTVSPKERES